MILKNILIILLFIFVCLASILVAVSTYRGLVWLFKKLNSLCDTWEEWVYAILLIDVVLMILVGLLILLFN